VDADLDTLATALYVRTDDLLKAAPDRAPWRPAIGIVPKISDAELVTLAAMQALLGYTSEAHWPPRYARAHLRHLFPAAVQCTPRRADPLESFIQWTWVGVCASGSGHWAAGQAASSSVGSSPSVG
jgi:hypothetical protein